MAFQHQNLQMATNVFSHNHHMPNGSCSNPEMSMAGEADWAYPENTDMVDTDMVDIDMVAGISNPEYLNLADGWPDQDTVQPSHGMSHHHHQIRFSDAMPYQMSMLEAQEMSAPNTMNEAAVAEEDLFITNDITEEAAAGFYDHTDYYEANQQQIYRQEAGDFFPEWETEQADASRHPSSMEFVNCLPYQTSAAGFSDVMSSHPGNMMTTQDSSYQPGMETENFLSYPFNVMQLQHSSVEGNDTGEEPPPGPRSSGADAGAGVDTSRAANSSDAGSEVAFFSDDDEESSDNSEL